MVITHKKHLPVPLDNTTMPRGKAWSKAESIALVEAFVHISEDEIIGVNQRRDTLFERVIVEAKGRYSGDWGRGTQACKSRWQVVSREVSKFISADLLVQSVERSGWNEDDYYNAAVKAYHGAKPKALTVSVDDDSVTEESEKDERKQSFFEFKEEWDILKHHEKWRAALSKMEMKRKTSPGGRESPSNSEDNKDDDCKNPRPIGAKKAKTVLAIKNSADTLIEELRKQKSTSAENRDKVVLDVLEQIKQSSSDNIQQMKSIVAESTDKIERVMRMKMLIDSDWSKLSEAIRENAQQRIEQYFIETIAVSTGSNNSTNNE
mmetsp:Transcript_28941/g.83972  ORF Transcript_28941/g.83972 Transcript_28941/m.83972 type:complete len:320 (+) Transcript_28941:64-1023(+)